MNEAVEQKETGGALESKAWLRSGPGGMFGRVMAGVLRASEGRVSFSSQQKTIFEVNKEEISVNWPWWEFGGGVHLKVAGKTYRISLVRPPEGMDDDITVSDTGINSIGEGRDAGKMWKSYFGK